MKMFLTSTVILFMCFFGERILCESSMETMAVSVNQSCSPLETSCSLGCCPFKDGVCCSDGLVCCEHGQTCIPFIGICLGAVNNSGEISLTSTKSTSIRSSLSECPQGTFECEPNHCCVYPDGVCCWDGKHCCRHGEKCDVKHERCIPAVTNEISRSFYGTAHFDNSLTKLKRKSPYKSCPGGGRKCPSYMSCCVNDNGEWGCCPNPSLPQMRYGQGECCDTIAGYLCCTDLFPYCTFLGCV